MSKVLKANLVKTQRRKRTTEKASISLQNIYGIKDKTVVEMRVGTANKENS